MKHVLSAIPLLASISAWADMPVLATDITANQKIITFGYSNISLTQDYETSIDSEVIDTNANTKSLEVILTGESNGKTMPVLSVNISNIATDDGTTDVNNYDLYAGFALEKGSKKHLLLITYDGSSESYLQNAYGIMGIFKATASEHTQSEYELIVDLELKDAADDFSGGHSAGVSLNSKLPLSNQIHLVSKAGLSIETDTEYSNGVSKSAGPALSAEIALSIQPQTNMEITAGIGSYLQHFQYYDANGRYALKETRTGIGFALDFNIAL